MKIDFDPVKSAKNALERGLPFERVLDFELCFTPIEDGIRIISFRKANQREVRRYEREIVNR